MQRLMRIGSRVQYMEYVATFGSLLLVAPQEIC